MWNSGDPHRREFEVLNRTRTLVRQVEARQLLGADPVPRADFDDTRTAEHQLERERVGAGRRVEEVTRRIDVRASVCTQMQRGELELSPLAIRLIASIVNGVLPGT